MNVSLTFTASSDQYFIPPAKAFWLANKESIMISISICLDCINDFFQIIAWGVNNSKALVAQKGHQAEPHTHIGKKREPMNLFSHG